MSPFPPLSPTPDDEKAQSPVLYVMVGLASILMVAVALAALVVPPALAAHFVIRGARSGQPILKFIGLGMFALWFVGFVLVGRRVMAPRPQPPEVANPE